MDGSVRAVDKFVSNADSKLKEFYKTSDKRFYVDDSAVIERIMRLGIEVRALGATPDEYRDVAIATLKNDFVKYGTTQ
jgi:hypothetical protein